MLSLRHCFAVLALAHLACSGPSRDGDNASLPPAHTAEDAPESGVEGPPLFDRDLFFADDAPRFLSVSRDGQRMIYSAANGDGSRGLYLAPFSADFTAGRQLIDANRVAGVGWSRDHRYLLLLADDRGDEDYHLHALDLADPTATLRDLTPGAKPGTSAMICGFPVDDHGRVVLLMNDRDPELADVYDLDLATGARKLAYRVPAGTSDVHCDRQGRPRLLHRMRADASTELVRIDGRRSKVLQTIAPTEELEVLAFASDHTVLARSNRGTDRDLVELVEIDVRTGVETVLHRDPEREVDLESVELDPVTHRPLAATYRGDRERTYPLDAAFGRAWEAARARHPEADMWIADTTDDLALWIVAFQGPTLPTTYYEVRPATGVMRELIAAEPALASGSLAPMRTLRYAARDGLEITAYLTTPRGQPERSLPLVVMVHGGPWARDEWGYHAEVQFLANRGYAVLQPNFRGSTGFGKAFLRAANRTWGTGAAQHDVTDGVAELVRRGIVDRDRVCIYGGSYGGYAALAGLAFTPELYACGISEVGPSNLVTLIESFPASWHTSMGIWFEAFGDPSRPSERADLEARSPLFAADAITAPLLLVHGANDPRVKQPESDRIAAALRARGREVRYLVADDEGHGFSQPRNRRALLVAMEEFLAAHLGGRMQPTVPDDVRARLRELEAAGTGS
ncbi:MAG TPA: S9 family peptidase [Nannocystaceae bacterium]|nr:S9 family peptidase [Nannocystaceae bacterium]